MTTVILLIGGLAAMTTAFFAGIATEASKWAWAWTRSRWQALRRTVRDPGAQRQLGFRYPVPGPEEPEDALRVEIVIRVPERPQGR